ncbi:MAG: cystathionine beta-lyase [Chloroflexi bacterium RBG_13_46_14]|nr:MAG: cystathionine beta-lyase [Chloroflexi bacterium RBG_13_46_14]
MQYDFDYVWDRKNTDSAKWGSLERVFGRDDVIPMWVADMDFPVAQPILDALRERVDHPFYGYTFPDAGVTESVVERMRKKFNWEINPEWVVYTPGVIPALSVAVRAVTHPGDGIVLQEPAYFPFFSAVHSSGCHIQNNQVKPVGNRYEMDFDNLERKFSKEPGMSGPNRNKAIIFCNPHNPIGRLWTRDEVSGMGEIVIGNGGVVIADEIHCEILMKGYKHTPFASISEEFAQNSITCMSPSKTFNLPGLEISSIIIPNKKLRDDFTSTRTGILPNPNLFGYVALEAGYRYGDEWLEHVLDYLQGNLDLVKAFIEERIPRIKVTEHQGTYLLWLDFRALGLDNESLRTFMREKAKVGLNDGYTFGESGSGFQRMNIACPRSILQEALTRIEKAVNSL